jgi:transcriptional regulator with XRE-family HTH domain
MPTNILKVEEIDRVYNLSGPQLKKTLDSIGMTQSELARRCGYASAARVCHLVKKRKTRISEKPLGRILKVLEKEGANIEGFQCAN